MKKVVLYLLVSLFYLSMNTHADIWAEREALSKIETELDALEELIKTTKALSNPSDRTQFNYQVLLSDVRKIRTGISHHLIVPMEPVVPSTVDALSSQYTEHQQ
jgi:RAQPRD family integrative conjugative element protein